MDLKVTITMHLKDEEWGISDILNHRGLNRITKEEIQERIEENIYDAIYCDSRWDIVKE